MIEERNLVGLIYICRLNIQSIANLEENTQQQLMYWNTIYSILCALGWN